MRFFRRPSKPSIVWATVAQTSNPAEAEIFAGLLRTANIPHYTQQESIGALHALSIGPLGQITILVPTSYEDEARALLSLNFSDDMPSDTDIMPD